MNKEDQFIKHRDLSNQITVSHKGLLRVFSLDSLLNEYDQFKEDFVEREKPSLEVCKWYYDGGVMNILILDEDRHAVGFNGNKWEDNRELTIPFDNKYSPSDMKEVKKLLIGEAEKYRGSQIKCIRGQIGTSGIIDTDTGFVLREDELFAQNLGNGFTVFDFKTGKWAEIIEEKKPLYTNTYGTEFFDGDRVYYVVKHTKNEILNCLIENLPENRRGGDSSYSEIMKEKECYKYLYENW